MSPWLRRFRSDTVPTRSDALPTRRLLCLPHAGGTGSAFAGWPALLPADVEVVAVQYPGRQDRLMEPCVEDMHEMADAVVAELAGLPGLPLTVFGHSMGSGLAYEVVRRLERRPGPVVRTLVVSARPAPHRTTAEHRHLLTDEDLVDHMKRLGGPGAEVYDHEQLRPLILPPLRADLKLLAGYRPQTLEPVAAPVAVFGAEEDPICPVEALETWREATTGAVSVTVFPGRHHYLMDDEKAVVAAVAALL
jgi:surfactin synthase thioesterase subunit